MRWLCALGFFASVACSDVMAPGAGDRLEPAPLAAAETPRVPAFEIDMPPNPGTPSSTTIHFSTTGPFYPQTTLLELTFTGTITSKIIPGQNSGHQGSFDSNGENFDSYNCWGGVWVYGGDTYDVSGPGCLAPERARRTYLTARGQTSIRRERWIDRVDDCGWGAPCVFFTGTHDLRMERVDARMVVTADRDNIASGELVRLTVALTPFSLSDLGQTILVPWENRRWQWVPLEPAQSRTGTCDWFRTECDLRVYESGRMWYKARVNGIDDSVSVAVSVGQPLVSIEPEAMSLLPSDLSERNRYISQTTVRLAVRDGPGGVR